LREKLLENELNKHIQQNKRFSQAKPSMSIKNGKPQSKIVSEDIKRITALEKELIELIFEGNSEITEKIFSTVSPQDFANKSLKLLAEIAYDSYKKGNFETAAIVEKIEDERLKNYVLSISLLDHQISPIWEKRSNNGKIKKDPLKYTLDTLKRYKILKIDNQIKNNDQQIETLGNDPEVINLMKLNDNLRNEKKLLINGSL
jgi:hypothetical protein